MRTVHMEDNHPKDGPDIMYRSTGISMADLLAEIHDKWGTDTSMDDITCTAEHIQVTCLDYDRYEPSLRYRNYICVRRTR